jgi:hypothetical protein
MAARRRSGRYLLMPSTVIRSYRYDPKMRELAIVFQTRRAYAYSEVPPETYTALKAAFSMGVLQSVYGGKFASRGGGRPTRAARATGLAKRTSCVL